MKIAVTSKSFSKNEHLINVLQEKYPQAEIKLQNGERGLNKSELIDFLKDCNGAIIGLENINASILNHCPNLKCVSKFGVGLNLSLIHI